MAESQIRVLSLNCWGLKYVSKNRLERIRAIANAITNANHDVVALQEIWVFADYEHVQAQVAKRLPYSKFFYSGALGAGLALFSRFPIVSTHVHPYSLNGAPLDVIAGDWFVGKAAASIVVLHPVLGQVQIFNTHLFAKGGEDGPEYNRAHRLVNAWELAKLVRQAAELGRYVIAAGDFNSIPSTLPMTVICDYAALSDSWVVTHPEPPSPSTPSTPFEAIVNFGVTADSPLNTYSAGKPLDSTARQSWGKRLDYIFYRQPVPPYPERDMPVLRAAECKVVMTEQVPGCSFSYSDHFGLEATLEIQIGTSPSPPPEVVPPELESSSVSTVIQALTACYRFSLQRSRKELLIFGVCLLILLAIVVGTSWLPHSWINPIMLVFTIFVSWLGTTMLYEGFLYGNWERNALMNVIEELEIYSKGLASRSIQNPRNSHNRLQN